MARDPGAPPRRRSALGQRPQQPLPTPARAARPRLLPRWLPMDRPQRRGQQHALLPASRAPTRRSAPDGFQLHAGAAAQLSRWRAARRLLEGALEQRLPVLWGQRPRQFRRRGSRTITMAPPALFAQNHFAAALSLVFLKPVWRRLPLIHLNRVWSLLGWARLTGKIRRRQLL